MSSRYPILDNRPIDQWKVTELKEELKRRKLPLKGLKDDLIKRLDEALRAESEAAEASDKDKANGFNSDIAGVKESAVVTDLVDTNQQKSDETVVIAEEGHNVVAASIEMENREKILEVLDNDNNKIDKLDGVTLEVDINSCVPAVTQDIEHAEASVGVDSANVEEELNAHVSVVKTTNTFTDSVSTEVVVSGQDSSSAEIQKDTGNMVTKLEIEETKVLLDNEASIPQPECYIRIPCQDLVPNSSVPENQVSEANPSLGFQVKYDSISRNSVSINQKNELKDTIIADNVKLEQDVVRPEMVEEPSSRNGVPVYDELHSSDVGELHEKKAFVEENSNNVRSPALNKTNSTDDVGYPEKLNLDRSSGDDSMDEDLPECKQFDSKFNGNELRDKGKSLEVPIVKEESSTIVVGDGLSSGKGDTHPLNDFPPVSLAEKRKSLDQASVGNKEPTKRQRRWNSETVKGPDPQGTTVRAAAISKDEPVALKPNFSRSDSSAFDDAPKERIVPPSQRTPTNSLRIDRFLRPFTLKAVQELLGKTGNVISFWMDQIKTHCYVTYSSVEEAIETRNAVYNLQWPPNGGRLLVAEYVDPEEVKMKLEAPTPVASISNDPAVPHVPPTSQPEPSPRQHREQPPDLVTLPPPPLLSKLPPAAREQPSSPPPPPDKFDQPIVTLDDLFRKTKAIPRIYYLPLSEEQVAAKLAAHGKSIKQ